MADNTEISKVDKDGESRLLSLACKDALDSREAPSSIRELLVEEESQSLPAEVAALVCLRSILESHDE